MGNEKKTGNHESDEKLTDLQKARKQYVAKRNDMIQKSKKTLSLVENKAVSYIFSKIQPEDTPNTVYRFDCKEFYKLMRWNKQSYSEVRDLLYGIGSQTWIITDEDGTEKIVHWFNTIHLKQNKDGKIVSDSDLPSRYIEVKVHEDLWDYVFNLQEQKKLNNAFFSSYQLQNVSLLSHAYSQNIYELLKTYENVGKWTFEYGTGTENDIQIRIATYQAEIPPEDRVPERRGGKRRRVSRHPTVFVPVIPASWKKFHFFERDVLKPAVKEINEYTDIIIDYAASKKDIHGVLKRRFSSVTFFIKKKTDEQKQKTEQTVDELYKKFDDQTVYKQSNIFEFIDAYAEDVTERKKKEEFEKEEARENAINTAKYKVAASVFYDDFTQKQILHLVEEAFKHISPLRVDRNNREMWAVDYISHYLDKIKATSDETRTSTYRRLLDCITKDYDGFAEQITVYDRKQEDDLEAFFEMEQVQYEENADADQETEEVNPPDEKEEAAKDYYRPITVTEEEKEVSEDDLDEEIRRLKARLEMLEKKRLSDV